jgi:alpha-ketoglutarate-dependent taurine dioxygenase
MTNIKVEPIGTNFGVRVIVDAAHLLDDGVAEACLKLLDEYGVLVFPEIGVSDEVQVAFSGKLGNIEASRFTKDGTSSTDKLGIYPVTLNPEKAKYLDYIHSNEHWHIDGTTYKVPPKATNLKCEQPPSSGGDTEFANLIAAYQDLPDDKKAKIKNLRVIHCVEAANRKFFSNPSPEDLQRWRKDGPPTEQPLVWKLANGHSTLVIGATADSIIGMPTDEAKALLDELLAWATQPKYCYRHTWKKGDMVIWNNPALLHRAHRYTVESGRLMHRNTIMGAQATS